MFTEEKRITQEKETLEALKKEPATSMMLAVKTGILRCNLTRYLRKFEKQKKITVLKEAACKITGHRAKYYSANPDHFPTEPQKEMFNIDRCAV